MRILLLEDGLLKNKNSLPIDDEDQKQGTFSIAHETLRTFIYDYRVTLYSTETVDQALELLRNPSVNDINKINTIFLCTTRIVQEESVWRSLAMERFPLSCT